MPLGNIMVARIVRELYLLDKFYVLRAMDLDI